jgi:hypothetical protein
MLVAAASAAEAAERARSTAIQQAQAEPEAVPSASVDEPERRRPGPQPIEPERVAPVMDPNAVPPPQLSLPREFIPVPDRWRLVDALGLHKENVFDPYNQNVLKGDKPIFGNDWFLNLSAISDTVFEPRRVPTPTAFATTATSNSLNTFNRPGQYIFNQNFIGTFALIKGNTAYEPPEYELHITPVYNINRLDVQERGIVSVDPSRGTTRNDYFIGMQEAFLDYHIRNVSERFDFDSIRVGIQPFSTDFRGFLFQDSQLGVRLFGNRDNNHWQYNLAFFRRIEKDTNSGLNDLGARLRQDNIWAANVYRQDFPVKGFTSQLTYVRNDNNEGDEFHYDKNGFLVRPAQIGDTRGRNYHVNYLGYNGDGHFGRFNLTGSFYFAFGEDSHNQFRGLNDGPSDIQAFFAAVEPSVDFDWIRVRLSGLFSSGDGSPTDKKETGFDAIFENPIFAGADTSYWIRQGIPLIGGGAVTLSPRNGVIPSLRSSKDEGQSNFVNPGLFLAGIGTDLDLLPELRLSTNFNYLAFANTASLEFLRQQAPISPHIGYDLSAALTYRPNFTQNVIFRLSGAVLLPEQGLRDLYSTTGGTDPFGGKFLYSVLANLILTY